MVNTGFEVVVVGWIVFCIRALLVTNRLLVRFTRRRHKYNNPWLWFGPRDWLVAAALPFIVAQMSLYMVLYSNNLLRNYEELSEQEMVKQMKHYYIMHAIYWIPLYFVKLAMLMFFLELTPPIMQKVRWAIYFGMAISFAGLVLTVCHYTTRCGKHIEYNWNLALNDSCNKKRQGRVALSCHLLTDMYIYASPFFIVSSLSSHSVSGKVFTFFMFLSGLLLVILAIPNFISLFGLFDGKWMWAFWIKVVEQNLAVILACLPALHVTLLEYFGTGEIPSGVINNAPPTIGGTLPQNKARRVSWFTSKYRNRGLLSTREVADGGENGLATIVASNEDGQTVVAIEDGKFSEDRKVPIYEGRDLGECSSQEPIVIVVLFLIRVRWSKMLRNKVHLSPNFKVDIGILVSR